MRCWLVGEFGIVREIASWHELCLLTTLVSNVKQTNGSVNVHKIMPYCDLAMLRFCVVTS